MLLNCVSTQLANVFLFRFTHKTVLLSIHSHTQAESVHWYWFVCPYVMNLTFLLFRTFYLFLLVSGAAVPTLDCEWAFFVKFIKNHSHSKLFRWNQWILNSLTINYLKWWKKIFKSYFFSFLNRKRFNFLIKLFIFNQGIVFFVYKLWMDFWNCEWIFYWVNWETLIFFIITRKSYSFTRAIKLYKLGSLLLLWILLYLF